MGLFEDVAGVMGLNIDASTVLILFIINVAVTIMVLALFKNNEYQKEIGIVTFFGLLLFEALTGLISWLIFIIPALILIIPYWARNDK